MRHNYEYSFEIKPGKPVYIQRKDALERGLALTAEVEEQYQPNPLFYHFKRRGGHVAAMRVHTANSHFSRFDLEDFFAHVTRTKIVRALLNLGWAPREAFEDASDSVVVRAGAKVLPFGFHQSPLLATLVLEQSALGKFLIGLAAEGLTVSVYMDDILISSNDRDRLEAVSDELVSIATDAGFPLSTSKSAVAMEEAEVFNCLLSEQKIRFLDRRMAKFIADHGVASEAGQLAIQGYIRAVSNDEHEVFLARLAQPVDAAQDGVTVRWFGDAK